ncbi:UNVERIFIED_CONTAM: hypothetical protein HDU68_010622 [Siphonaria sp. JEL0065]|nr:hypothetical protein HDU68_010622 [Siphonaria sp. JEL0065]
MDLVTSIATPSIGVISIIYLIVFRLQGRERRSQGEGAPLLGASSASPDGTTTSAALQRSTLVTVVGIVAVAAQLLSLVSATSLKDQVTCALNAFAWLLLSVLGRRSFGFLSLQILVAVIDATPILLLLALGLVAEFSWAEFTSQAAQIELQQSDAKSRGGIIEAPEPKLAVATAFSTLYFTWMNPLMRLGGSRPIRMDDLPALGEQDCARSAVAHFSAYKLKYKALWKAVLFSETKSFLFQFVLATLSTVFGLAGPYFLYRITGFIQNPGNQPILMAFLFAVAFGFSTCFRALCDNHAWHLARKMSIRIKAVLVNEVYCKSLRRIPNSSASSSTAASTDSDPKKQDEDEDASVGKIVTLMSTDAETIRDSFPELYDVILLPFHIMAAVGGLLYVVGWPALAGLAVMVLTLPLTYWNSLWNIRVYEKLLAAQDGRTNVVNEVLQGIRIIKYFAWEKNFLKKIDEARQKEMKTLIEVYLNGAVNTFIWLMTPLIVSFVTLTTLTKLADRELNSQLAFTCLSLFNSLRIPLMALPYVISDVFRLKVAFDRVTKFLEQEELEKYSANSVNKNFAAAASASKKQNSFSNDDTAHEDSVPVIGFKAGWFKWYAGDEKTVKIEDAADGPIVANERTPLLSSTVSTIATASTAAPVTSSSSAFTLREMNIEFPVGVLSAVVGATGAGKSSLLQALLGEMKRISGDSYLPEKSPTNGGVAYVAQTSWLQNATIRDNITFGETYDPQRYDKVIKACALVKDLATLAAGDLTEIGEKGINLSGGQKQRVSLARALYSRASVILMDDPLSAVDAPTAKHLFEHAICGPLMKGRTRVLVTHATSLVLKSKHAKYLVAVSGGGVLVAGPVRQALQFPGVPSLVGFESVDVLEKTTSSTSLSSSTLTVSSAWSGDEDEGGDEETVGVEEELKDYANGKTQDSANKLIDAEGMSTGAIKSKFYWQYLSSAGTVLFWLMVLLFNCGDRVVMLFNDYWLKLWAEAYDGNGTSSIAVSSAFSFGISSLTVVGGLGGAQWTDSIASSQGVFGIVSANMEANTKNVLKAFGVPVGGHGVDVDYYIRIYALIGCTWVGVFLTAYALKSLGSYRASKTFHNKLIERIVYAPMRFFDTTPIGRILNRCTKDISVLDDGVMSTFENFIGTIMDALAVLIVVAAVTPVFLVSLIPISLMYYTVSARFLACQREIKRLDSTTRSPIYSMFSETLVGVSTIRAYGAEESFMAENLKRVDTNHRAFFYMWSANRWFGTRVSTIASCVILCSAIGTVAMRDIIGAGLAGLSLTWVLSFSDYLVWIVRIQAQLEMNMNCVERISEYTEIEQEAAAIVDHNRPPANWPQQGSLTVSNLEMRYAPDQEPVLQNVTFSVKGGEKIGVVGRTGAGKSSLTLSLFRIVEPTAGTITIDGIDISTIGLYDLRSKITMIPQDPVLFAGTIRSNLDPFGEYDDAALWSALKQVRFMESLQSLSSKEKNGKAPVERSSSETTLDEAISTNGGEELSESERTGVTLEATVSEGGNNFSQGQRQLLCLSRALLKSNAITVFDEATASVDYETDIAIQQAIRGAAFANTTVLSIAHRLRTIADYDKVLVLDKGRVMQFGTPLELMQTEGIFKTMCEDSGEFKELMEMAKTEIV